MAYDLAVWTNFNKNQKPLRAESIRYCKKTWFIFIILISHGILTQAITLQRN